MVIEIPPILIGGLAFFLIGGGWMLFYWRVIDPLLRRVVGRLVGAPIYRGDKTIWVVENESEDSVSWRAGIIRPIQMACVFTAGMVALLIGLAVTIRLSQ